MDQVLHGKVVQLECGGSMRIEIIVWIIVWGEIRLVGERKGGGGCERGGLWDEYGGVEVLGGNWRGYSLTRGGQYAGTGHTLFTYGDWDSLASSAESGGAAPTPGRSSG